MQRYLIVVSDDYEEDDDSSFVTGIFDDAVELFVPGVWVVRSDWNAKRIAESLGVVEGGERTGWSSLVLPVTEYFGFMHKDLHEKLRALKNG